MWKRYELQSFQDGRAVTSPFVLEAPSPGAAVEIFLACHGLFNYSSIQLGETTKKPDIENTKDFIVIWIPDIEAHATELDKWHNWEPREEACPRPT